MTALVSMARFGIDPGAIDAVLITHLQGDHYGGMPLIMLEACINVHEGSPYPPPTRTLRVAGPHRYRDACAPSARLVQLNSPR